MVNPRIAIVSSYGNSLLNFRGPLIKDLVKSGKKVYAFAPDYTAELKSSILNLGAYPIDYYLSRSGLNPLGDIKTIISLLKSFRSIQPDIIFTYTHKPNIYGTIAGLLARVPRCHVEITGLGYFFIRPENDRNLKRSFIKFILQVLYYITLKFVDTVFFLNQDDQKEFVDFGIVPLKKCQLVPATGLDLNEWPEFPPVIRPTTFIYVGRLLREKGVVEYIKAAKIIKAKHPEAVFIMLGSFDNNPGSLTPEDIKRLNFSDIIVWPGDVKDVRPWLAKSSVFVLPSYREGVPRSTQEAMATGRPIITTDAPGCRLTVKPGLNGFLVPICDVNSLTEAMERFISNPDMIPRMGKESRKLAELLFDANKNNKAIIDHFDIKKRSIKFQ